MGFLTDVLSVETVLWVRLMQASLIITPARALLNDKTGGRWSNDTLMSFLTMTARELMRDVKWPPARLTTWSIPGVQEYQIPDELIRVYSVYLQGQLCTETTIQTLEGHQIQRYDQCGFGSAPLTGGGGPPGNAGNYVPQWTVQPPMSYPVANQWGYPRPDAEGWSMGQPPRYYLRGGYIGFVPIPSNAPGLDNFGNPIPNITIDCVVLPQQVLELAQPLFFPDLFSEALIWGVVEKAKFSDDTSSTKESRTFARERYNEQAGKMRMWAANYTGDQPGGPKMTTDRPLWPGRKQRTYGSGGYP